MLNLCLFSGRVVELLEALEAMAQDNQPIPPRAMILSRKYRTLVSSWIEPLQEEAELGHEIDYMARSVCFCFDSLERWLPLALSFLILFFLIVNVL